MLFPPEKKTSEQRKWCTDCLGSEATCLATGIFSCGNLQLSTCQGTISPWDPQKTCDVLGGSIPWCLLAWWVKKNPPTRVGVTSILILCRVQNVYQNPKSKIRNPKSKIRNPKSKIQNPKSKIQNQKSKIRNPKPKIRNPKSKICTKRIAT